MTLAGEARAANITDSTCPVQADNTMRYNCTIELDGADDVRVGIKQQVGGMWRWSEWRSGDATHPVELVLYNFKPGVAYDYRVETAGGDVDGPIALTTPALPTDLSDLKLQLTTSSAAHTKYVLFDTWDCTHTLHYLVALNITVSGPYIAWYQDIAAASGGDHLTGWSYTDSHTILANVDHAYTYEWALDGSEVAPPLDFSGDCGGAGGDHGECPHHDAYRAAPSGNTYVVTATQDFSFLPTDTTDFGSGICSSLDGFTSDGFQVYDDTQTLIDGYTHTLMGDMAFDPSVDGGPDPVCQSNGGYWYQQAFETGVETIDWTHVNSVFATHTGTNERVLLSSREWNQVMLYDPATHSLVWTLNGDDVLVADGGRSAFDIAISAGVSGDTYFGGQHHATMQDGLLLFFDNRNDVTGDHATSRAIQLDLDLGASPDPTATIMRSWVMRQPGGFHDGVDCTGGQGGAVILEGTESANALVTCGSAALIEELDENDGTTDNDPVLRVGLPTVTSGGGLYDTCTAGADSSIRPGFYRAWPLLKLGEF